MSERLCVQMCCVCVCIPPPPPPTLSSLYPPLSFDLWCCLAVCICVWVGGTQGWRRREAARGNAGIVLIYRPACMAQRQKKKDGNRGVKGILPLSGVFVVVCLDCNGSREGLRQQNSRAGILVQRWTDGDGEREGQIRAVRACGRCFQVKALLDKPTNGTITKSHCELKNWTITLVWLYMCCKM